MIILFVKGPGLIFFCCALYFYKPPKGEQTFEKRVNLNGGIGTTPDGDVSSIDMHGDVTCDANDVIDDPAEPESPLLTSSPSWS